jgi:hypothetical protein
VIPKIKFTAEEDRMLVALVEQHGVKNWATVAQSMGTRNARQCRERWSNYLRPYLRTGHWTPEEDFLLETKFAEYGTKWHKISLFFVQRSALSLRNRHMAIERQQRPEPSQSPGSGAPPVEERAPPAAAHISTPFSDEELRMMLEDIFA